MSETIIAIGINNSDSIVHLKESIQIRTKKILNQTI